MLPEKALIVAVPRQSLCPTPHAEGQPVPLTKCRPCVTENVLVAVRSTSLGEHDGILHRLRNVDGMRRAEVTLWLAQIVEELVPVVALLPQHLA